MKRDDIDMRYMPGERKMTGLEKLGWTVYVLVALLGAVVTLTIGFPHLMIWSAAMIFGPKLWKSI